MRFLSPRLGFGLSLSLRFCRGVCPRFVFVLAALSGRFAVSSRLLFVRSCRYCVFVCHVGMLGWCAAMRFLSPRLGFGLCRCLRFCRGVCPRFVFVLAALSRCLPSVHACLFSFVRKKETACGMLRSYSAGSRSPFVRSRGALRLSAFVGSLRVWAFLYGDLDGVTGDAGNGGRGRRRGLCALLRGRIGLAVLSAGSTLGLRAPDCAKESSTLWTLLRGWSSERVRFTRRGCVGSNIHPCKKRQRPNHRTHARKTRVHGKT